jgi:hypothetical protein
MLRRLTTTFLFLLSLTFLVAQDKPADTTVQFHGTYEELKPAQKKLIDEWYAEYNRLANDHSDPAEYNQFSLSTRTTFEAVTHALMTTKLTDKSGQSMGSALDLVQSIEAINGKVPQARGDLQFRVYVLLKPDAQQKLKDSSEFFRDRDNTVYHHGYPLNYRQDGGAPSIQVSMAKDARHADIDVDYRSSKFPLALINGHLTAANSDVRAGNNTQRHNQRWEGLADWWRNLFGLPDSVVVSDESVKAGEIPPLPPKGEGKLEDAVQAFLTAWLVQQKPEISAAYLSPRSFACLEEYGPQAGNEINAGVAPYLAVRDMARTNILVGKVATLSDAAQPSTLQGEGLKLVKQSNGAAFSIYQVSNSAAAEFECDPSRAFSDFDKARVSGTGGKSGQYFASVFRLKAPKGKSDAITFLWTKQGKYWKVVAWEVEPEEQAPGASPDTRRRKMAAATPVPKVKTEADSAFLEASHNFLHSWLVAHNFDQAATYFSPRCNECVNLYLGEGEKAPSTPAEYAAYLRNALTTVGKDVGTVPHLRDALEPVQPDHEDLRLVGHAGEGAYTVVAAPDYLASSFTCEKTSAKSPYVPPADTAQQKTYGNYYATLFALRTPGEHPAALTLLWAKDAGQWKIIAYELTSL